MSPIEAKRPQTRGEAATYNQGVLDVLAIAKRSAEVIGIPHDKRQIPKSFASAALDELAKAGAALLIGDNNGDVAAPVPAGPPPTSPTPVDAVAS